MCVCLSMYVGVIAWVRGRDMSMRLQFFCIIYSILFIPYCFFLYCLFHVFFFVWELLLISACRGSCCRRLFRWFPERGPFNCNCM